MKHIKIEIKWAIIFSVITLLWAFVEKSLGWHNEEIANYISNRLFFTFLATGVYVFAYLDKRKNYFKGKLGFINGVMSGAILSFFVAVLYILVDNIVLNFISPDFLNNLTNHLIESGKLEKEAAETFYTNFNYIKRYFFITLQRGFLTGIMISGLFYFLDSRK